MSKKADDTTRLKAYHSLVAKLKRPPTLSEMATQVDGCYQTLRSFVLRNGLEVQKGRRNYSVETFKARIKLYEDFKKKNKRPPTRTELCKVWGVSNSTSRSYIAYLRKKLNTPLTISERVIEEGIITRTIGQVVAEIQQKHRVLPSEAELSRIYRVSRERIRQIINKTGVIVRRGKLPLWDVDPKKFNPSKGEKNEPSYQTVQA